jgi:hypothetical protein
MKESQFKLVQNLADDISKLLQGPDNCDLQLVVGSGESKKTYWVHSVILQARSPYFSTALASTWAKKEGDKLTFSKPNVAPEVFEVILK